MTQSGAIDRSRLKRMSAEGAWVALGQVIAILGGLAGVRILTEALDPSAYGDLALGITLATLAHQCVFGPLGHGTTRFWAAAGQAGTLPAYLVTVRRLALGAAAMVALAGIIGTSLLWVTDRRYWAIMVLLACGYAVLRGFNSMLGGLQNAARQRAIVALHQGGEVWLRFLLAAALVAVTSATGATAMGGFLLALSVVVTSQLLFFRRRVPQTGKGPGAGEDWGGRIRRFAWPFAAFGVFSWAQFASSRWSLEAFATTSEVGYFSVLFQLGFYPMSLMTAFVIQYLAPIFYERAGDASDPSRNDAVQALGSRLTFAAMLLTILATALAFLLHEPVFRLLAAAEYRAVSHLLPWLVLAGGLVASAQTVELNLMSMLRTSRMVGAKVVTATAGVAFNVVGARYFGTPGVVAANVAFAAPYLAWMLLLNRNLRKGAAADA